CREWDPDLVGWLRGAGHPAGGSCGRRLHQDAGRWGGRRDAPGRPDRRRGGQGRRPRRRNLRVRAAPERLALGPGRPVGGRPGRRRTPSSSSARRSFRRSKGPDRPTLSGPLYARVDGYAIRTRPRRPASAPTTSSDASPTTAMAHGHTDPDGTDTGPRAGAWATGAWAGVDGTDATGAGAAGAVFGSPRPTSVVSSVRGATYQADGTF